MLNYLSARSLSDELLLIPGKTGRTGSGKWLPVWMHLMDTAAAMTFILEKWLPLSLKAALCRNLAEEQLNKVCLFLALAHDIGKLTPGFVCNIARFLPEIWDELNDAGFALQPPSCRGLPHALMGAAIVTEWLGGERASIAAVIGAHHGMTVSNKDANELDIHSQDADNAASYYGKGGRKSQSGKLWAKVREEWIEFALHQAGYEDKEELPGLDETAQLLLSGLLIMADWLASNPEYFPLIQVGEREPENALSTRGEDAFDALERFLGAWESTTFTMDEAAFEERFGFAPNAVQRAMISAAEQATRPGIFILEAQMGVGKTEAALAAAEVLCANAGCGGMFFGLPTQATANGIFPRLCAWAEAQSEEFMHTIRLAHGMASLNEDYRALFHEGADITDDEGGLMAHGWFAGRKQALLANFVIGTVDQLLMAALRQRHAMLRHTGIAGKVAIIDECHSYDAYMSRYLETALAWLGEYGAPVIILSATLPAERRRGLVAAYTGKAEEGIKGGWADSRGYPLLTWTDGGEPYSMEIPEGRGVPREIEMRRLKDEDVAGYLHGMLKEGGCAGVIANTVRRAQQLAAKLKAALPDKEVMLIHSRYIMPDRAAREAKIMERLGKSSTPEKRSGLIVVGTQVLEQSLDIDFDLMITDLCPMDLLLQRLGRLHRHDRIRPGLLMKARCIILGSDGGLEEGAKAVYGEWLLMRTRKLLPDVITLPHSIPSLVQNAYMPCDKAGLCGSELEAYEEYKRIIEDKESRANGYRIAKPGNSNYIYNMLNCDIADSEARAQAAVRDGGDSITVLVMMRKADGSICFLPWQGGGAVPHGSAPSDGEGRRIAAQQLRLPAALCAPYIIGATIDALEEMNRRFVPEWQQSPWIKGELVLLMDEDLTASIAGYELRYGQDEGLTYGKEDSVDG